MKPWHYIEIALALLFVGSYVYLWRKYVHVVGAASRQVLAAGDRGRHESSMGDYWYAEVERLRVLEEALRNYGWNGEPIDPWLCERLFPKLHAENRAREAQRCLLESDKKP